MFGKWDRDTITGLGKEELNLIEAPWICFRSGGNRPKTITTDRWIITGTDAFGLPGPKDLEVYWALVSLCKLSEFKDPVVRFSVFTMLTKILCWPYNGKAYHTFRSAIRSLTGVQFVCKRWFDARTRNYVEYSFHILDQYKLHADPKGVKTTRIDYAVFSQKFFRSLQAGNVKALDWKVMRCLRRPLSKRLWSYLDRHLYGKPVFPIRLSHLAVNRLGLTPQSGPRKNSVAMQIIRPAILELEKLGLIMPVTIDRRREDWLLVFRRGVHPDQVAKPPPWKAQAKPEPVQVHGPTDEELRPQYDQWATVETRVRLARCTPEQRREIDAKTTEALKHCPPMQNAQLLELTQKAVKLRTLRQSLGIPDYDRWKQQHCCIRPSG